MSNDLSYRAEAKQRYGNRLPENIARGLMAEHHTKLAHFQEDEGPEADWQDTDTLFNWLGY